MSKARPPNDTPNKATSPPQPQKGSAKSDDRQTTETLFEKWKAAQKSKDKYFAGHGEAMLRLGMKELRNAFDPSIDGSVTDTEIGLFATQTQGEIAQARDSKENAYSNHEQEGPRDNWFWSKSSEPQQAEPDVIQDIIAEADNHNPDLDPGHDHDHSR